MNNQLFKGITLAMISVAFLFSSCGQKKNAEKEASPKEIPFQVQGIINNMVTVEGGTFWMGARNFDEEGINSLNKPMHRVTLSSFLICRYEVTQDEWVAVMGTNPSRFKGERNPVENVTLPQIREFIKRLNEMTQMQFRLPTEAEWEFAARGGNLSKGTLYSGSNDARDVAWCSTWGGGTTNYVGSKAPNELGLYDMSGNVIEVCSDLFNYYNSDNQVDPKGPDKSIGGFTNEYVTRGGGYGPASSCKVANRNHINDGMHDSYHGFRLAL